MNGIQMAQPGDVVAVDFGLYRHVGVLSDRRDARTGEPLVFSSTRRRGAIFEEPVSEFGQGRPIVRVGYPGVLPRAAVLARARALLGRPWSLLYDNCEHFVREVHGLRRESPQVQFGAFAAVLLLVIVANID